MSVNKIGHGLVESGIPSKALKRHNFHTCDEDGEQGVTYPKSYHTAVSLQPKNKAAGKVMAGLTRRRAAEASLYRGAS